MQAALWRLSQIKGFELTGLAFWLPVCWLLKTSLHCCKILKTCAKAAAFSWMHWLMSLHLLWGSVLYIFCCGKHAGHVIFFFFIAKSSKFYFKVLFWQSLQLKVVLILAGVLSLCWVANPAFSFLFIYLFICREETFQSAVEHMEVYWLEKFNPTFKKNVINRVTDKTTRCHVENAS